MQTLLFLCHGAGNGGAERVITTLANEFSKRGNIVFMVTTNEDRNDYKMDERIERRRVISVSKSPLIRSLYRVYSIRKILKETKPNCAISFSAIPNIQLILASFFLHQPIIISERTDPSRYPTSKIGKFLRSILYCKSDRIVFQTEDAMNYFRNKISSKGIIIENPIRDDLPKPYYGVRDKRIVGIGYLGEQKNWMVALQAAELFFKNFPEYVFDIYGEGPDRNNLQCYIDNHELLRDRVKLRGFSYDAVNNMNRASMYISSSDYEGISNAMLEALATGVPTICTDCPVGGARKYIDNYENGILVPVRDSQSLYMAMLKIAGDAQFANKLSEKSITIKERLSLSTIVDVWEKLINECQ